MASAADPRLEGNEAYRKGDYEGAITKYAAAMAAGDTAARMNRSAASMALNRYSDAIVDLSESSHTVKSLTRLSKCLTALGALAASQQVLDAATELLASSADANAAALIREAEDLLRPATEVFRDSTLDTDLVLRYGTRSVLSNAEESATRLLQAANVLPYSSVVAAALGFALLDAGRLELAAAVAKALIGMQTSSDDGKLGPLPAAITLKVPEAAGAGAGASAGDVTVDLSTILNVPPAVSVVVLAYLGQGDLTKAQHEITEALSRDPDAASSEGKEAIRWKKALNHVTKAKEAANELYTAKKYREALAAYQALADLCKAECDGFIPAFVHSNIAAARLAIGTPDEAKLALDDIQRAIRVWPFSPNKNAWPRKATCLQEAPGSGSARNKHEAIVLALEAAQKLTTDLASASPGGELASKLFGARTKAGEDDVLGHPENDAEASFALEWSPAAGSDSASGGSARGGKKGGKGSSSSSSSSLGIPALSSSSAPASSNSARLKLVDATATWCGPCQQIGPVFEKMGVSCAIPQFIKVDGDKCRGTMGKLGVRAFPTIISFLDGKELDRLEGADPRRLQEMVENGIAAWKRQPKKGLPGASEAASSRSPIVKAVYSAASSGSNEMNTEAVVAVAKAMGMA
jgi:thioredoxin 1